MITQSTCATCRQGMQVTDESIKHHPTCPEPRGTRLDVLAQEVLALYALEALAPEASAKVVELEREIEVLQARPPQLREAALAYVSWGWPVFPLRGISAPCTNIRNPKSKCLITGLCQCPKIPATPNGFKDATLDAAKVDAYWTRYPDANIGLPTGIMFDVVDIDVPKGVQTLCDLLARGEEGDLIPHDDEVVHGKVVTASGGQHWYVKPTGDGNLAGYMPGIDFRGVGGYVVAPPSWLGERGRSWSWLVKPSPDIRV